MKRLLFADILPPPRGWGSRVGGECQANAQAPTPTPPHKGEGREGMLP